jgi:hypothetical protein
VATVRWLPFLPVARDEPVLEAASLNAGDKKKLTKLFKVVALAIGWHNFDLATRAQFERSPYDFERIIQAADTDSYVRQGLNKYRELMWKEGWEVIGENQEAVTYLYQRLDFMELSMGQPFNDFLSSVTDQLFRFHNAFIVKSRGNLGPFFPTPIRGFDKKLPLVGFELLPTETVEILRDKKNVPLAYRQRIWGTFTPLGPGEEPPTWPAEDIIHLHIDRKPGRSFGTPFLVNALDDVIALRQMEEDIQNLVHQELFPLYKYKVGTETHPAEPDEIEAAAAEIAGLRTEGAVVIPERHDVEVIGSEGNALDATGYLEHFKERVCVGLGVAPIHLGISLGDANRSVTDRLDVALYDRIKTYQRYFAGMVQLNVFSELLYEGGFDPIITPSRAGISDRCIFKFKEIDVDTQVKRENHEIQKYSNNVQTLPETRLALGHDPSADEDQLLLGVTSRLAPQAMGTAAATSAPAAGKSPTAKKPDAQPPSTGGSRNLPNPRKGTGNVARPANQHGRRSSPGIRRDDLNGKLDELVLLIADEDE